MTQCWPEGELRAYLDGELPSREMESVALHLAECPACRGACADLQTRAARISAWMEEMASVPADLQRRRTPLLRYGAGALATAAAAVMMFWLTPKAPQPVVVVPPPPPPAVQLPAAPPRAEVKPAIIRRAPRKRSAPPKPKPQPQPYLALDNEPIESGIVVRVGFDNGNMPADVIFGPDGRARAFRLVSDPSGGR